MTMPWNRCKNLLMKYMYKDRVTVYRQQSVKDDEGADDYMVQAIYQDIPCHLTQYGKELQSGQNPREFFTKTDLRICLDPKYDILPNDILTITHDGQTFQLNAAKAFKYPTHQEISVRREEVMRYGRCYYDNKPCNSSD